MREASRLRLVVGVSGGIAAYKAVGAIRAFVMDGHDVQVVATQAAYEFVLLGASQEFIVDGDGGTHSHQHAAMRSYIHLGIIW